jgi:hypothetical protein
MGLFAIILIVLAVAGGAAYLNYTVKKKRREAFATMAMQLGLTYSAEDPYGLVAWPFTLFEKGEGRGVENVMWGAWQGMDVRAFDYWYYEQHSDGKSTSRTYYRFDCTIVPIKAAGGRLTIYHENVLTRLAGALTFKDIQFESDEFNRAYDIKSQDKKFANDLIDARMMDWLLKGGAGYSFEVVGNEVLCFCRKIAPADFIPLLGTAKAFLDHIPAVVYSLYPSN